MVSVRLSRQEQAQELAATATGTNSITVPATTIDYAIRMTIVVNSGSLDDLKLFTNDAENTTNAVEIHDFATLTAGTTTILSVDLDKTNAPLLGYLVLEHTITTGNIDLTLDVFFSDAA